MSPRADANRNRETILDHAVELLQEDPEVSMQAIADAASVTRMTVYRHFPTRDALILAAARRTGTEVETLMDELAGPASSLEEVVDRLVAFTFDAAVPYRALIEPAMVDAAARAAVTDEPVIPVLAALAARGEVRADAGVAWLGAVVRALLTAAVKELGRPEVDAAQLRGDVRASLLAALRA